MRISVQPAGSLEELIGQHLISFLLKFLFILGAAFLVFILTSRTYVPPAGMNSNVEQVVQSFTSVPPPPY